MSSDYRNATDSTLPRGIRNNNPGNIKYDGTAWQGSDGDDGTFVIFVDMGWGCRALSQSLANMEKSGLVTISQIINQWAPGSENNTQAYINAVCTDMGIGPDDNLPMDQGTLAMLMRAIINHENGDAASTTYVTDQDITDGIGKMNAGLLTIFQATAVAAETNPGTALAVVGLIGFGLWAFFGRD